MKQIVDGIVEDFKETDKIPVGGTPMDITPYISQSDLARAREALTKADIYVGNIQLADDYCRIALESPTEPAGEFLGGESWGSSSNE